MRHSPTDSEKTKPTRYPSNPQKHHKPTTRRTLAPHHEQLEIARSTPRQECKEFDLQARQKACHSSTKVIVGSPLNKEGVNHHWTIGRTSIVCFISCAHLYTKQGWNFDKHSAEIFQEMTKAFCPA